MTNSNLFYTAAILNSESRSINVDIVLVYNWTRSYIDTMLFLCRTRTKFCNIRVYTIPESESIKWVPDNLTSSVFFYSKQFSGSWNWSKVFESW